MINFSCIQDLIDIANAQERTIDDIVVEYEATHSFKSVIYIKENMQTIWQVMKESAEKSINNTQKSVSGMVGGDAQKLFTFKDSFAGDFVKEAASYAVAVAETNAAMGKIAACPTAGSCGMFQGL